METYKVVFEYTKTYKGKIFFNMSWRHEQNNNRQDYLYFPQSHSEKFSSSWSHCFSTFTKRDSKTVRICTVLYRHLFVTTYRFERFEVAYSIPNNFRIIHLFILQFRTQHWGFVCDHLVCWLCIGDREILWMFAASKTLFMKVSEFSEIISEHCLFLGVKLEYWSSEWILLEDSSGGFSNSKKRTFQNITISASSINDFCGSSKSITPKRHEMRIIKIPSIR